MQMSSQGTGTDQTGTKTEANRFPSQSPQPLCPGRTDQWLNRVLGLRHHSSVHSNLLLQGRLLLQGNLRLQGKWHLRDRQLQLAKQLLLDSQLPNLPSSLQLSFLLHPLNLPLGSPRTLAPPL